MCKRTFSNCKSKKNFLLFYNKDKRVIKNKIHVTSHRANFFLLLQKTSVNVKTRMLKKKIRKLALGIVRNQRARSFRICYERNLCVTVVCNYMNPSSFYYSASRMTKFAIESYVLEHPARELDASSFEGALSLQRKKRTIHPR